MDNGQKKMRRGGYIGFGIGFGNGFGNGTGGAEKLRRGPIPILARYWLDNGPIKIES